MSMFNVGRAYCSVTFDQEELRVIRIACAVVAAREQSAADEATEAGPEEYADLVKKANTAVVAGNLAALFKPGQEILIEREDLEPLAEVIRKGSDCISGEEELILRRGLARIDSALAAGETDARSAIEAGRPQPRKR
ncbi:hypothetical protein [Methanocella arvoryzae]|uniref:hypothetical protein n=1 Tax=Methanocella arvoryzae TaxID=1175445 RepID=UPI0003266A1E|nr:hypothetical protein [Methanocella arvoryzae]